MDTNSVVIVGGRWLEVEESTRKKKTPVRTNHIFREK